jgi:hypothetical protein
MFKSKIRTNKLLSSIAIILVLSCSVFAQQREWKTFSPENGVWSIPAPCAMKPDAEALETPSTKGNYSCNDSSGFFSVVYRDNSKWKLSLAKPFIKSYYRKIRSSFIKSTGGELVKDVEFSNGSVSGREVYIKMQSDRVFSRVNTNKTTYRMERLRMFFQGNRFYLLIAILPEDEIDNAETNSYFNSFAAK